MTLRLLLSLIATTIVVVASAAVQAQPRKTQFSVKLGNKVVALPAPEGYEEATTQWEAIKTRTAATEAPDADSLAGYLTFSDCDLLRKGQPPLYPSWAKIAVLRAARDHDFSRAEYAGIVEYLKKNDAAEMDPENPNIKDGLARLDQALSKEYSKNIKVDLSKPKPLGEFDHRPNVFSRLFLMNLTAQAEGKDYQQLIVLAGVTLLHVKQRVVLICTYKKYESKADADALTRFTTKWVNEIVAANRSA